ncbi:hypothetical protein EV421DRAFT_1740082 [Armillaria borealis]|uniref:Uncharacterized protein n=1 Tax=Armillaria borealis TaxID=47425 RepID=A0AA39J3Y8_9AGAR|nr:hypothetical protein EV421DRAFT_1740082 [Armillaria borealis]
MNGTILPPKDSILAASFGPGNGGLLIVSGCALVIRTTLVMSLGGGQSEEKKNAPVAVNESVSNSEYHGSVVGLTQSNSTRAENGFLAPAMQQNRRWLRRWG